MPMKVTVCFDNVRVIVPCGDGEILVKELIEKAVHRYKKATGKSSSDWINVSNLKTISGGGILDPDDQLVDVVDDREQLIAIFEEKGRSPGHHHNGGDGASASSTGTASPDIFQSGASTLSGSASTAHSTSTQSGVIHDINEVVVTAEDFKKDTGLTVRRNSETALDLFGVIPIFKPEAKKPEPVVPPKDEFQESDEPRSETDSEDRHYIHSNNNNNLDKKRNQFDSVFSRDSTRQSLSNNPEMFRWLEAAERQEDNLHGRQGPVGSSSFEEDAHEENRGIVKNDVLQQKEGPEKVASVADTDDDVIVLLNDGGPLGIHVIPDFDENGRDMGLMIQGIEKGGRVFKDGRLKEEDKIVEINGQSLLHETFKRAQGIFREAMKTKELRLRVKKAVPPLPVKPPPMLPKPKNHSPLKPSPLTLTTNGSQEQPVSSETKLQDNKTVKPNHLPLDKVPIKTSENPPSPSKRTPPAVPVRHPSTSLSHENKDSKDQHTFIAPTNTRRIGKRINIQLKKGELGLGFSVTSRDNMTGGEIPIYIKNILPQGAAIADGRLKPGDRLLEVNSEGMTGKTQSEAVAFLRKIPKNSIVELVVSRQEIEITNENKENIENISATEVSPDEKIKPAAPIELKVSKTDVEDDSTVTNLLNSEVILLDIPLNNSEATGLGVSVKGKSISTPQGSKDLGIFIKSVMPGGAAFKDGRLIMNDQLLEINGEKLVGLTNIKAMEKLRNAMQQEGPIAGHTFLSVARKTGAPSPFSQGDQNVLTDSTELVMQGVNSALKTKGDNSQIPVTSDRNKPLNPIFDRLMGNANSPVPGGLRNESYTRATQDSFLNDSKDSIDGGQPNSVSSKVKLFQAPTVHPKHQDEVIIENDAYSLPKKSHFRPRPHSTIGVPIKNDEATSSTEDIHSLSIPKHRQSNSLDTTHQDSDLSPEGDPGGFSREGFGRQSMSEKRKGHIDPRTTEQFWRVRSGREQRTASLDRKPEIRRSESADSIVELYEDYDRHDFYRWSDDSRHVRSVSNTSNTQGNRHSSNLKRSTSLEDLTVSDSNMEDKESPKTGRPIHRPRACNESFRAAVDRSYESQSSQLAQSMDTLEEESTESEAFSHGTSGNSARSSMSSESTVDEQGRGKKKPTKEKKSGGILKGFLRFGRKSTEEARLRSRSAERPSTEDSESHQLQREQAWQIAQNEKLRLQQEQRRQQQQQAIETHRAQQQQQQQQIRNDVYSHNQSDSFPKRSEIYANKFDQSANQKLYGNKQSEIYGGGKQGVYLQTNHTDMYGSKNFPPASSQSQVHFNSLPRPSTKTEKIQQLRAEHQRKHQERQGHYPLDAAEEYYERRLIEDERRRYNRSGSDSQANYSSPTRGQSSERPNSRQGPNFMSGATEYSPHPSLSDDSEYSHASSIPNKQQQIYNHNSQYLQPRPTSRGYPLEQSRGYPPESSRHEQSRTLRNYSSEQPLPSRNYPAADQWYRPQDSDNNSRHMQYRSESSNNVKQYYNDQPSSYRERGGYQVYNGRRVVQSMADPGSAKV